MTARSQPRSAAAAAARSWSALESERSNAGRGRLSWRERAVTPPTARTTSTTMTMISQVGMRARLERDGPRGEVRPDLALDALQGIVHRLAVAAEPLPDGGVGVAVEIERQHARLELGEHGRQAGHERAQLL